MIFLKLNLDWELDFIDLNLRVRQGDNLNPALFKIFINDLPKYLDGTKDPADLGDLTV